MVEKCVVFIWFSFFWCPVEITCISVCGPLLHVLSLGVTEKSLAPPSFLLPSSCSHTWLRPCLSLLFSRLNSPSSLCLPSYDRCSHSIIIFMGLCWTCCSTSVNLLFWGAQHSRCVLPGLSKGEEYFPPTYQQYCLWVIFVTRAYCWLMADFCLFVWGVYCCCSQGPASSFLQSCFPTSWSPVCACAWGCSFPGAELCICYWTSWGSSLPLSSDC